MGGKNSAPAPPDYGPLIAANEKTAKFAQKLANEQWQWAKGVYAENKGLMKDTNTSFLKSMEMGRVAAEEDRARYKSLYQPMEDRLIREAKTYDTPERRAQEAGAAQASVAQQFDAARNSATSQLESFGINPSSTRFAALDINARLAEAATKAAAGTTAIRGVEDTARKLTAGAVDVGRGYPANITASAQQGVQAGGAAQLGTNQAYATGAQAMGTGPQWLGGSNEALGNWGNTLNNQYQNQIDQFKANQSASSGFGSTLGMLAGIGMKMYGFEEGGVVPPDMSPSRGAVDDDVPAAVSVGEVIVPSDVVNWLGEKHFNKLAEKARKEKSETRAVPTDDAGVRQYAQGGVVEPSRSNAGLSVQDVLNRYGITAKDYAMSGGFGNIGWEGFKELGAKLSEWNPYTRNPVVRTPGSPNNTVARTPGSPDNPVARIPRIPDRPDPIPVFPTPNPGIPDHPRYPSPIPVFPTPGPVPPPGGWPREHPIPGYQPPVVGPPRGEYPTYPDYPRGPGWDGRGRGVRTLIDPSLYPNQAVPVR